MRIISPLAVTSTSTLIPRERGQQLLEAVHLFLNHSAYPVIDRLAAVSKEIRGSLLMSTEFGSVSLWLCIRTRRQMAFCNLLAVRTSAREDLLDVLLVLFQGGCGKLDLMPRECRIHVNVAFDHGSAVEQ